ITSVQQQYPWTNTVDITYTSTGIAEENTYYVVFKAQDSAGTEIGVITNDLKVSQGSTWVAQWQPPFNVRYENCTMTPYVYKGGMDDYMVVDLETWQVTFEGMSTQDASNKKYNTNDYKTKKLVLRKIEKDKGYFVGKSGNNLNSPHTVTLSKNYYIGIFDITEAQYERIANGNKSATSTLPKSSLSWNELRGSAGSSATPGSGIFKTFAVKTSLAGWDLPTATMYEIAARAGSSALCPTGNSQTQALLDTWGWGSGNSGKTRHNVGLKAANAWGLYDVVGNVAAWTRDSVPTTDLASIQADAVTPIASGNANNAIIKKGSYNTAHTAEYWQFANLNTGNAKSTIADTVGFRIAYIPE
ncbi:MAG: SUMF1/EgtB/PvdO family nonheme iron enzyme, partial [Kiritimatiellae bacterium]|nr:SUMF1/EgtB/PvdO family nonheme iron enzyme [Kiritimatiellia bacterium]